MNKEQIVEQIVDEAIHRCFIDASIKIANERSMVRPAAKHAALKALEHSDRRVRELESQVPPIENGKNRYGVDVGYFRNLINRELNRGLSDYTPDELARNFARMARTADSGVLKEPEFSGEMIARIKELEGLLLECRQKFIDYDMCVDEEPPFAHKKLLKKMDEMIGHWCLVTGGE